MTAQTSPASPFGADGFEPMNAPWLFDDAHVQHGRFAAPVKKKRKSKVIPVLSGLLVAGTVAGAVFLGLRLDNQHLDPEPASASEVARQGLAVQATRIANHARGLGGEPAVLGEIGVHAESWASELGGVWLPWPDGNTPSGHTNPALATGAPPNPDRVALLSDLDKFSGAALSDSANRSASERRALVAMAADAKILAARLATASNVDVPAAGTLDLPAVAAALAGPESLDRLSRDRQWLEKDATLIDPQARTAVETRIESITTLEEELLASGVEDRRAAMVPYPELSGSQTLTSKALEDLTGLVLDAAGQASPDQVRAIVAYVYSLYQTDAERSQARILDASER